MGRVRRFDNRKAVRPPILFSEQEEIVSRRFFEKVAPNPFANRPSYSKITPRECPLASKARARKEARSRRGGEIPMEKPSYQRILLKISGEGLAGEPGRGIDFAFVREVGQVIKACVAQGVQVGLVIGGGNFWRGAKDGGGNMERTRADQMGMLATVINSLAVQDVLEQIGQPARVLTSIPMGPVGQITSRAAAEEHFAAGRVVIFAGGTGNPYFSTDTAAVLRAAEIQADMILLAKNIDGVYSADPKKDPNAVKYDSITYDQVLADHLQVMDLTATSLALEHHIPVMIFALADPQNIQRAVMGEKIGTIVEEEKK